MTSLRSLPVYVLLIALAFGAFLPAPALAEGEQAVTADPTLPTDVLSLRLEPLRKDQLAAEADAWTRLLADKVAAINDVREQLKRTEGEAKDKLVESLAAMQEERAVLVERVKLVLGAWTAKGGDASELETYVETVGGLKIDLKDTGAAWDLLKRWVVSEQGGIKLGKNILLFLLILLIARFLANVVGRITNRALKRFNQTPELLRNFLGNLARNLVFFVGLVVALSMLGVNIGPFLAAMGAAGLVIGLALQDVISNFASGMMILLYRPYDVGDVIAAAGITGKVEAMNLVSTSVKTPDNQVLVVPNNQIWGSVITNVTGSATRRVDMVFGIGYDDDIEKAQKVLESIVAADARVLKDPAPVVNLAELADSSVNFNVRPWVKTGDYWDVKFDVTRKVKERFDAEGISIPYPQQEITVRQVGQPA